MKRIILIAVGVLALATVVSAAGPPAGPGEHVTPLLAGQTIDAGTLRMYNTPQELIVEVDPTGGWLITEMQLHVGLEAPSTDKKANPAPGKFPFKKEFDTPAPSHVFVLDLQDDLGFNWGQPWEDQRIQHIALHADLVQLGDNGEVIAEEGAWASGPEEFLGSQWGWWFDYELAHPAKAHFIDSPVGGLNVHSPTVNGKTDESGGHYYFPGERVEYSVASVKLGSAVADHKVSPLDIFESADTDDPRVINMARLLQTLDADADPQPGITITAIEEACLEDAVAALGLAEIDYADDAQMESILSLTEAACTHLDIVSAEDAKANLDRSLDSNMFRKNVSKTPDLASTKAKLNIMGVWFPALRANGDPAVIEYFDENSALIRTIEEAKPIVITYTDEHPDTGAEDTWAAISRDDGNTWKRKNLSRSADRSSFTLANGFEFPGHVKKPVFQVKGNNILVSWSSKFCKGGKPGYAIDDEDEYLYDDPYYTDDIWGVAGPQRSHDYADDGFPEVGELPYSCVWVARGTVVTQGMINSGGFWATSTVGDIVWFKPERLTSGRRDALQIFMGGADGAGFAVAFQEDPKGVRPGQAHGPGSGWSGATTNHKTDIWYSYITMADFRKIDMNFEPGGDPEHDDPDFVGRPKALVPLSLPVRLSDNDVVNTDNLMVDLDGDGYPVQDVDGNWIPVGNYNADGDGDGTHRYGYEIEGLCDSFYEFTNEQGALKKVCVTADNRLLDGDTGASRANVFLQTYTKPDGTKSAWAIMAYEETKGVGGGAPDHTMGEGPYGDDYVPESGKNVIYHSFDFQNPNLVSAGNIVNFPERDEEGNLLYLQDEGGTLILDWLDQPQLAYENSRRPRFILQGKAAAGASNTVMLILYKEGQEGMGRPSDIFLRRVVSDTPGNPYRFSNIVCDGTAVAANGDTVCVDGAQNMSTVYPTIVTDSMGDPETEDPYGAVKVVQWEQRVDEFDDPSWLNPYEDARAHRGQIRGDLVTMGYSYTPNWAASRNGNDKYDFYVRRSFDGGLNWTTDPAGSGVTHCDTFTDPLTKEKTEVCNDYAAGAFEQARNVSQLKNNKSSVIEPRIVCPPGTIKVDGVWTGIDEDKQNKNVCYFAYGTSTNPKPDPFGGEQDPVPQDLFYSFTQEKGESYFEVEWIVNPDSDSPEAETVNKGWGRLAKGDPEQGEVQLRATPDGSRFYSCWLAEGEDGSDIMFRRIMASDFDANVADVPPTE